MQLLIGKACGTYNCVKSEDEELRKFENIPLSCEDKVELRRGSGWSVRPLSTFRAGGLWFEHGRFRCPSSASVTYDRVQWLRLALSNGPIWVDAPLPCTWGRKQIQFLWNTRRWTKSKISVVQIRILWVWGLNSTLRLAILFRPSRLSSLL
jgi:hypothetical protein